MQEVKKEMNEYQKLRQEIDTLDQTIELGVRSIQFLNKEIKNLRQEVLQALIILAQLSGEEDNGYYQIRIPWKVRLEAEDPRWIVTNRTDFQTNDIIIGCYHRNGK